MSMSEGEIVTFYKQAKRKANEIRILAELNNCNIKVIIEILKRWGVTVLVTNNTLENYKPCGKKNRLNDAVLQEYIQKHPDQGLREIALGINTTEATVRRHLKSMSVSTKQDKSQVSTRGEVQMKQSNNSVYQRVDTLIAFAETSDSDEVREKINELAVLILDQDIKYRLKIQSKESIA